MPVLGKSCAKKRLSLSLWFQV